MHQFFVNPENIQVNITRKDQKGDYTVVVFPLLKISKKSPDQTGLEIGQQLKEKLSEVADFEVIKGFLNLTLSKEYWAGWILAYYQWISGKRFRDILDKVSMMDIIKLYPTLHEASEEKFVDTLDNIIKRKNSVTRLQLQRKKYGYSQREFNFLSDEKVFSDLGFGQSRYFRYSCFLLQG